MMFDPVIDRDGIGALRELHDLVPECPVPALLDLAEWLVAVTSGPFALLHPDIARKIQTDPDFMGRLIQLIGSPGAEPADLGDKKPDPVDITPVDGKAAPHAHVTFVPAHREDRNVTCKAGKVRDSTAAKPAPAKKAAGGKKPARTVSKSGLPWSKEDDEALQRMRRKGMTYRAIGEALGRSEGSVHMRYHRNNDTPASLRRETWAEADKVALKTLRRSGLTNAEIAARLGRTPHAVKMMVGKLGLDKCEWTQPQPAADSPAVAVKAPDPVDRTRIVEEAAAAPVKIVHKASDRQANPSAIAKPAPLPAGPKGQAAPSPTDDKTDDKRADLIEKVRAHLDRMPYDPDRFDPHVDLRIASDLLGGVPPGILSAVLELPKGAVLSRFSAMIPEILRDGNGKVSTEMQQVLLEALRLNAKEDMADAEAAQ